MIVISLKDVINNIITRFIKHGKLDKSPSLDEIKKYLPQAIELCNRVCRNRGGRYASNTADVKQQQLNDTNRDIQITKPKSKSKSKPKSKTKPTKNNK